jgi:CRP-like cAMP-binding protein
MDLTKILTNIEKHITLDVTEIEIFQGYLKQRKIRRKEKLSLSDEVCSSIFFVNNGALRAYHIDENGDENIIMFAVTDWWITDMYSFTSGKQAVMTIDALEDSDLLQLDKRDLEKLFGDVPKFERFFRIIFQNAYIREQLRVIQNLSLPAEERYTDFLRKYPQFVERVTLKQIASYLGITPEFLSVLRKKKNPSENS